MALRKLFSITFVSLLSTLAFAAGAHDCPKQVVLSGPSFINHQQFPSIEQLKTNFNQMLHDAGGTPVWSSVDLQIASGFVAALEKNVQNSQIVLQPSWSGQACVGLLASMPFTVSNRAEGYLVEFDFNREDNWPVAISISEGVRSPLAFQAFFPSNCSNCSSSAELLEFRQVSVLNN